LVLFNSPTTPSFDRVSIPLVIGVSLVTSGIFFTIVSFALRARLLPVRSTQRQVLGRLGVARTALNPTGTVQVNGELWTAKLVNGETLLPKGEAVEIIGVEGNKLQVKKAAQENPEETVDQPVS
jgi:membrane-bound serine protease (ClpP class)